MWDATRADDTRLDAGGGTSRGDGAPAGAGGAPSPTVVRLSRAATAPSPTAVRPSPAQRLVDVVIGGLLAAAALPVIAVAAVGMLLAFRTWPFFVQERMGAGGRPFRVPKLRTLPPGTPAYMLKSDLDTGSVPWLARALRRTHLDELPQLFLVLGGQLSLVGPRPKMPDDAEPVPPRYGAVRASVPQGCTGLWQVSRASHLLPHEAPEYDFFYVGNRGLRLDGWILWRTVLVMTGLGRRVDLQDVPAWCRRREAAQVQSGQAGPMARAQESTRA